jgi:hypothetical protein
MPSILSHVGFWLVVLTLYSEPLAIGQSDILEPVNISLANAKEEPRIKILLPPQGSKDTLEFISDGISIRQKADSNKKSIGTGFELSANSKSDFSFLLVFECPKLDQPKTGWGQGVLIRFLSEDEKAPAMTVGYAATKKLKSALVWNANHTFGPKQEFATEPLVFKKGSWLVERKGNEIVVSVDETGQTFRELKRIACDATPIARIQILCTRQDYGNSPAEFLFKQVMFAGDEYFASPAPQPPYWTLWRIAKYFAGTAMIVGLGLFLYRPILRWLGK